MKEYIYTIPLNDALACGGECPLCTLEQKLENDGVAYALGPAMMEPDHRIQSNATGYCRRHYEKMLSYGGKLSYALVLQTHLFELEDQFKKKTGQSNKVAGFFSKSGTKDGVLKVAAWLDNVEKGCIVCEKLDAQMEAVSDNFIYLWSKEKEFRDKVAQSKGVCLPHLSLLLKRACKVMEAKELEAFAASLYMLTTTSFGRLYDELDWFVKKHDYRFQNEPWKTAQDAVPRAASKLSKFTQ